MKKTAVSEYGYINAKLRARLSSILTEDFQSSLINSENIDAAMIVLEQYGYSSLVNTWNNTADIQSVEFELFRNFIAAYRLVLKNTNDELKATVELLSVKPEIENIKTALRLWYSSVKRGRPVSHRSAYVYKEIIHESIDWVSLINAVSFEDIVNVFENTIYSEIFRNITEIDKDTGIFGLELKLDKFYYRILRDNTTGLRDSDKKILDDIIATEIDLQNISWIIRYHHFYKLKSDKLAEILIPGGHGIDLGIIKTSGDSENSKIIPFDFLKKNYPEIAQISLSDKHNFSNQAILFEQLLDETRKNRFNRMLTGYPFTIGIILVFFFMVEREIKFISTLLNGKNYNIQNERLGEMLL